MELAHAERYQGQRERALFDAMFEHGPVPLAFALLRGALLAAFGQDAQLVLLFVQHLIEQLDDARGIEQRVEAKIGLQLQ